MLGSFLVRAAALHSAVTLGKRHETQEPSQVSHILLYNCVSQHSLSIRRINSTYVYDILIKAQTLLKV